MKLAFSTRATLLLPADQVAGLAREHGFHGVEVRTDAEGPVHTGLTAEQRDLVTAEFGRAGVETFSVATDAQVAAEGDDGPVLDEIRAHLELAADLGASFVRVRPGGGRSSAGEDDVRAARRLAAVAPRAADLGVRVLLQTHGSHSTGADVARVLGLVGHGSVGAVWDVLHTWLRGEQPGASYRAIAPYLGYVQVKDVASADDTTPLALGAGVLPLTETIEVLSRAEWDGWLCWEYEQPRNQHVPALPALLDTARRHLVRLLTESA